jgi:RNA polymerase sigma factor (sigma-70 family)
VVGGIAVLLIKNPELLQTFRRGDRAAMEMVYRHYVKGVSHFLQKGFSFRSQERYFFFKGYRSPSDLHNSVQEVFRRAFEEKARLAYNGVNSYANWILAIARNFVINQFRNREVPFSHFEDRTGEGERKWDNEITEEYSGVLYGTAGHKQDVALEKAELQKLIAQFMGSLSEEDRELVRLRFTEGNGQEEAAKALGSTRMKVRTQEGRVRRRLVAFLRNSGYLDAYMKSQAFGDDDTRTQHIGDEE